MYTIKFFYNLQFIYIVKKGEFFMSVNDHKCHACGADLTFDPSSQKWVCEYCGESYTLEDIKKYQAQSATQTSSNTSMDGYNECHCKSCGAQIIMDENTSVTECVYCGNTAIITERLEGNFAPQQLIPFKKTKDDALAAFSKAPVIEVDKNVYRCAKDDYKDFIEYMQSEGWSYVTQLGSVHFFEKGDKIVGCELSIKKLYAEWTVEECSSLPIERVDE